MGDGGTNPITSGKPSSLFSKFTRYNDLLHGYEDFSASRSWYAHAYPDDWPARVLFVLHSEARRANVAGALAEWSKQFAGTRHLRASAFALHTLDSAREMLAQLADAPAPPASIPTQAPIRAEEERLRPGRVSVRGEQLVAFAQLCGTLLRSLAEAHRSGTQPPAPPPEALRTYEALALYAERGRKALAAYGLKAAV